MELHPDYISRFNAEELRPEEPEIEDEDDGEVEDDVEVVEVLQDPDNEHVISLTHKTAARLLRVQHALVYASIQGRTMRDKHLGLLDVHSRFFTIRHLIVALSRATHGKFLNVFNRTQEADFKLEIGE